MILADLGHSITSAASSGSEGDESELEYGGYHELDRTITFVDAAIAIAMTLLILPLLDSTSEIRNGGEDGGETSVSIWFQENKTKIGSFLLSYYMVLNYWISHNGKFARVYTCRPHLCTYASHICLSKSFQSESEKSQELLL